MRMSRLLSAYVWIALVAAAPAIASEQTDFYVRSGLALDWSQETRFRDKDCASESPAALYSCGEGPDGAPLSSRGDFGAIPGFELGVGYVAVSFLRLEAFIQRRPNISFAGRTNFLQTTDRQEVSADVSALSGMLAAYVGLPRLGPLSLFIGGGGGLSRIAIDEMQMKFPQTTTIVPGGRRVNLAYMATAGIATSPSDNVMLDFAWRYTDSGTVETGKGKGRVVWHDGSKEPLELDLAETQANLSSHGLRVFLRYAF